MLAVKHPTIDCVALPCMIICEVGINATTSYCRLVCIIQFIFYKLKFYFVCITIFDGLSLPKYIHHLD